MTTSRTGPELPVELPLVQESEPSARPGCKACLGISTRRKNRRSTGDHSGVSDANVEMRRHQAEGCAQ
ncbi:hypothetical protein [Streptomyces rimosus]|uniref:hypothetical protein n=1 Tax=Streptomyces rimosus TaxID=1927 RepID=UPI00099BA8BC|nr:hypothetical protein [Streptomyces rimosus]